MTHWSARQTFGFVRLPTDGSVLVMGGVDGSSNYLNDVWKSGSACNGWTQLTAAASWAARENMAVVADASGNIYLMGGDTTSDTKNDVWKSSDGVTWTQLTAAASWAERTGASAVYLPDGSIILMGGEGPDGELHDVWISTDGTNWTEQTAAAGWAARAWFGACADSSGNIFVLGGYSGDSGGTCYNDVWKSSDKGVTWTCLTSSASWAVRDAFVVYCLSDGTIIIAGGGNMSTAALGDVWSSSDGVTWTEKTSNASWAARIAFGGVADSSDGLFIFGGNTGSGVLSDIWKSPDKGITWTEVEDVSAPSFTSIIQSIGPMAGGVPVLITGSNFTGVTAVSFGGTAAAAFTILEDTHIVACTPAHAAGTVALAITGPGGTLTVSSAYIFTDYTDTTIETTVDHGMDDACAKATFEYQGTGVGLSDSDYLARTVITIPDYADVDHVKFVGVCVSGNGTFRLADEKMQLTAYDDFLFLQKKPLDDMDRAVLPADYQTDTNIGRSLNWKSAAQAFAVGYQVWGGTSGARGRILAVDFGTNLLTLAPAYGKFVDSEELYVGDTLYAYADGASVDIPITTIYGGTVYPEDWLLRILGGTSAWSTTTGVYPEKIVATTHDSAAIWDTDPTDSRVIYAKPFYLSEESNRYDAAKELTLYLRRILHRKPVSVSGTYYTGLYWVRQSQIDDATYGLDLPSAVTIAAGSPYLASDIDLVSTGDDQYERIHVYSTTLSGKAIDAFYPLAAPTTRYREYKKEYSNYATQADLDDLAEDLYNAMSPRNQTWTVTLYARSDLEVYQKLTLSGFSPRIPDGTYRIIRINPVYGLAVNKVQVWFITNTAFQSQIRLGWTYQDSIQQTVRILERYNSKKITDRPVTYLSQNSDGTWNIQDDTGMVYYGVQDGGTTS